MRYRLMKPDLHLQKGASMIEVLVSIFILSFGMLALGAMLSFAVQMPKLSGYRSTATNLATAHVERIRANPKGFATDAYTSALSYDGTFAPIDLNDCKYDPGCDESTLARMDNAATNQAARRALPAGGMILKCDTSPCVANSFGNLWIVWQQPDTYAAIDPKSSDNCPSEVTATYTDPKPRCLYVRFKI